MKNNALRLNDRKIADINTLLFTESYRRCLYWFFSYPNDALSLSDLAKNLRISKTNARQIVTDLIQKGFLLKEEIGKVWRISVNKDHFYNKTLKIAYNLDMVYSALPIIIDEIVKKITPNYKSIILFGSYRRGDNDDKSDLDIAVETSENENVKLHEIFRIDLGHVKKIRINLIIFNRNKIDLNLFNNIANGIVLDGFLEVRP